MKVLVIYCHPVEDSFCAALRDAAVEAIEAKGCEARIIDLYAENFDPVMRAEERRSYNEQAPGDPALRPHIELVQWAEALVFIYPTWWYGLPAMLKGWLDRVWAKDVAFTFNGTRQSIEPLMGQVEKIAIVTTCGAPWWWSVIVGQPGRKTILRGIRALCGWRCKTLYLAHYMMDSATQESRAAFLKKVRRRLERF
ncbi:NAD(P)H dehydrogenase [Mesorhizobium sp. Root554]|uniref:NAD(P)H-dependent oxidoreductase n=1 Tax=unclassified Mesorhizobium TaxID=325217 RepID=UPI0006FC0B6C|nr:MULTISPECIES: NAD(P)H-dependent oxidoreductase [unclassified Mesorhizobium]KQZ13888.1 NAD(P)H dehydrogenase [Mesorhizobium sp. Root1471]KQZ36400.1 NAD(P)H dehydrogenase [Mesorhizobium sp. Root554]